MYRYVREALFHSKRAIPQFRDLATKTLNLTLPRTVAERGKVVVRQLQARDPLRALPYATHSTLSNISSSSNAGSEQQKQQNVSDQATADRIARTLFSQNADRDSKGSVAGVAQETLFGDARPAQSGRTSSNDYFDHEYFASEPVDVRTTGSMNSSQRRGHRTHSPRDREREMDWDEFDTNGDGDYFPVSLKHRGNRIYDSVRDHFDDFDDYDDSRAFTSVEESVRRGHTRPTTTTSSTEWLRSAQDSGLQYNPTYRVAAETDYGRGEYRSQPQQQYRQQYQQQQQNQQQSQQFLYQQSPQTQSYRPQPQQQPQWSQQSREYPEQQHRTAAVDQEGSQHATASATSRQGGIFDSDLNRVPDRDRDRQEAIRMARERDAQRYGYRERSEMDGTAEYNDEGGPTPVRSMGYTRAGQRQDRYDPGDTTHQVPTLSPSAADYSSSEIINRPTNDELNRNRDGISEFGRMNRGGEYERSDLRPSSYYDSHERDWDQHERGDAGRDRAAGREMGWQWNYESNRSQEPPHLSLAAQRDYIREDGRTERLQPSQDWDQVLGGSSEYTKAASVLASDATRAAGRQSEGFYISDVYPIPGQEPHVSRSRHEEIERLPRVDRHSQYSAMGTSTSQIGSSGSRYSPKEANQSQTRADRFTVMSNEDNRDLERDVGQYTVSSTNASIRDEYAPLTSQNYRQQYEGSSRDVYTNYPRYDSSTLSRYQSPSMASRQDQSLTSPWGSGDQNVGLSSSTSPLSSGRTSSGIGNGLGLSLHQDDASRSTSSYYPSSASDNTQDESRWLSRDQAVLLTTTIPTASGPRAFFAREEGIRSPQPVVPQSNMRGTDMAGSSISSDYLGQKQTQQQARGQAHSKGGLYTSSGSHLAGGVGSSLRSSSDQRTDYTNTLQGSITRHSDEGLDIDNDDSVFARRSAPGAKEDTRPFHEVRIAKASEMAWEGGRVDVDVEADKAHGMKLAADTAITHGSIDTSHPPHEKALQRRASLSRRGGSPRSPTTAYQIGGNKRRGTADQVTFQETWEDDGYEALSAWKGESAVTNDELYQETQQPIVNKWVETDDYIHSKATAWPRPRPSDLVRMYGEEHERFVTARQQAERSWKKSEKTAKAAKQRQQNHQQSHRTFSTYHHDSLAEAQGE